MSEEFPAEAGTLPAGFAPGSRVAGYKLEEQIGAGGMAVVFRARDERLQRQVALKILAAGECWSDWPGRPRLRGWPRPAGRSAT